MRWSKLLLVKTGKSYIILVNNVVGFIIIKKVWALGGLKWLGNLN